MTLHYHCPATGKPLQAGPDGLLRDDGYGYPYLPLAGAVVPDFLQGQAVGAAAQQSLGMYDTRTAVAIYRNFLDWLFATFATDEAEFRQQLLAKLQAPVGGTILITGCGLGDDIPALLDMIGPTGKVYANDLAAAMVIAAAGRGAEGAWSAGQVALAVCNAQTLPFADDFFDGAFHFGGINLFDDRKAAIAEMNRVVKPGGRVVFGDEGVAPWLRDTDYGKAAIANIPLWAMQPPLEALPPGALEVNLSWVLGNCFYLIDFQVSASGPHMNMDIPHQGRRGGSMRSRYSGQLEGVSPASKAYVLEAAARSGLSVHDWLEQTIQARKDRDSA